MKRKRCLTCGHIHECKNRRRMKSGDTMLAKGKRLGGMNWKTIDRDEAEKTARGYTDARSIVRRDGSERLHGEDWDNRKLELHRRSDGACEMRTVLNREHDENCSGDMHHPHHIVKRSVKRDDRLSNLAGLSWACHKLVDNRKIAAKQIRDDILQESLADA